MNQEMKSGVSQGMGIMMGIILVLLFLSVGSCLACGGVFSGVTSVGHSLEQEFEAR